MTSMSTGPGPQPEDRPSDPAAWGRVADDGTVYVRTADGEREVGSWHAGDPAAGLAHFGRRYDELATRVRLLRDRLRAGTATTGQATKDATQLRRELATAAVVGDLGALERALDEVATLVAERRGATEAARAQVTEHRRALVTEAEQIAESVAWTKGSDRLRTIVDEWKAAGEGDQRAEAELWRRLSAARRTFGHRRKAAYTEREAERAAVKTRKEELITEAEALTESTQWRQTADRYKELLALWKSAGRAGPADETKLWARFRAAQDAFFTRRNAAFAARDAEQDDNRRRKEALLDRAERLDPAADPAGALAGLREVQAEWDRIGRVPRPVAPALEARLRAVEERVRTAGSARRDRPDPPRNPFVEQLTRSVGELEGKLASARNRGDASAARRIEEELSGKRRLLDHAERAAQG